MTTVTKIRPQSGPVALCILKHRLIWAMTTLLVVFIFSVNDPRGWVLINEKREKGLKIRALTGRQYRPSSLSLLLESRKDLSLKIVSICGSNHEFMYSSHHTYLFFKANYFVLTILTCEENNSVHILFILSYNCIIITIFFFASLTNNKFWGKLWRMLHLPKSVSTIISSNNHPQSWTAICF